MMTHAGVEKKLAARRRLAESGIFLVPRPQPVELPSRVRTILPENHPRLILLSLVAAAAAPWFWALRALGTALHPR